MAIKNTVTNILPEPDYIRRFRLTELLGIDMSTIDSKRRQRLLPHPIKLTDNVIAFDVVNINNWLTARLGEVA
ncbi:helix-turn-helix transcriptional regulator [Pectobacterium parmentieri]|uniref:helix-turn-helix transcriptional regulator n=1 Tax=Pectobacterium parmentieri TaxID=1905730 RepID=UPI0018DF871F|nr:AlpA family phage regulatory protein [Pectobacterium parmentieri]MBI0549639.1 AlpA family phage regulatory protein [Pectobacterium parmentieri]MBI0558656.1 AlpA family phage regulatory protein [Pectobacterium parmentieri]MBI0562690.1 AlpA family phage regulatory protein [Pectobacterium parmentieri]